jgi:hypothetical protein
MSDVSLVLRAHRLEARSHLATSSGLLSGGKWT